MDAEDDDLAHEKAEVLYFAGFTHPNAFGSFRDFIPLETGVVPTKFAAALVESPEMEEMQKARTFLGRLGTAEDMAAAVAFLASEDASYITGETLMVAGGNYSRL